MKILKNSTYEGLLNKIEFGEKEIQNLKEQVKIEINERAKAVKQKKESDNEVERLTKENEKIREERGFYEREMNQAKEELAKLVAENAQLKKQAAECKPQRTSNGRFAKKKENE